MFQGSLFTRNWLAEGVIETPEWQDLDDQRVASLWQQTEALLLDFMARRRPSEAETEDHLIYPMLELIGWEYKSVQQNMTARGRKDVPDALLYADADADARARPLDAWQRFRHGAALVEAKKWDRPLDREGQGEQGVPSTQIMHYLRRAAVVADGKMPWGILTNGRQWRLYYQNALSVAEDFFEIDLGKIFGLPGSPPDLFDEFLAPEHAFRLFLLIFGPRSFLPTEQGRSFHLIAREEARRWEEKVRKDLAETVFENVFPTLLTAIPEGDQNPPDVIDAAYAEEVRQAAMFMLYRLLFVLYAEDRNLLPDERGPYADYCLTRLRQEIEQRHTQGQVPLARSTAYWSRLETIFGAIAEGDDDLGIPPYNGGLFDPAENRLLSRVVLADDVLTRVILPLSHREDDGRLRYINYRDLSVQQLGSIYESILEYGVELDGSGGVRPRSDNEARHRSGSYYTPEPLVSLIIDKTVGPLVEERRRIFEDGVAAGMADASLAKIDPAMALLDLRILDPAMGSGHFLVSLVDWLSDKVLTAIGEAENLAGETYASPLVDLISSLRGDIVANARAHGWPIVEEQLDDRHIVRRMVLKRCVHGVDLNPMAVELAKVALWLHSFTVGAPLSFLDHHLRCGNSVLGAWVRPTIDWMQDRGALIANDHLSSLTDAVQRMEQIEQLSDTDLTQVYQSKELFEDIARSNGPIDALLSMAKADDLMGVLNSKVKRPRESAAAIRADGDRRLAAMTAAIAAQKDEQRASKAREDLAKEMAKIERAVARAAEAERQFERAEAMKLVHEGIFGDPSGVASGAIEIVSVEAPDGADGNVGEAVQGSLLPSVRPDDRRRSIAGALVREARELAEDNKFFHWEVAFPGIWGELTSRERIGGFDAVIGNPPYIRQEEFAPIKPSLATSFTTFDGMADLYVYFYEQGVKLLKPGGRMGFVVTNKWLKTGYAEHLRRMFAREVWVEFLADFGHARHLFPDADVHPCIICVRKPVGDAVPDEFDLAVIPRDDVPKEGLSEAVASATYRAKRSSLTEAPWVLETPDVAALIQKLHYRGVPLTQYAGVKPYRGVLTGLNEAFLIDSATRDRLVSEDVRAAEIIKPYLRGQDIGRWLPEWAGLWMIFTRRGVKIDEYPSVLRHLTSFRTQLEPKPKGWKPARPDEKWPGRKEGRYQWYEIQDSTDYWRVFEEPKIIWQAIQYFPNYALSEDSNYLNNKAFALGVDDKSLIGILNSPLLWWLSWRHFPHMKDEALSNDGDKVSALPIAGPLAEDAAQFADLSAANITATRDVRSADQTMSDWLRVEFGLKAIPVILREASKLDSDAFVSAVRSILPKRQGVTPTQLRQLRDAFADVAEPARATRHKLLSDERSLGEMVERSYGLTPEEIALMWRTAPPRMPIMPSTSKRSLKVPDMSEI